jgi:RNA polymerase sigma factor (sigma-70 family)
VIKFAWTTRRNPAPGSASQPVNGATDPEFDPEPEETLDEMVRRIRHRLKNVLRNYDIPFQDAEDLLQDSLLDALRKWDAIYNKECWLIGTLRFKCSNYWKRIRTKVPQSLDLPELEELCPPLPPPQEKRDEALDLRHTLSVLDPRHQKVLWLRYAVGFTPEEVADQLGYRHSSVRKLTQRAMLRLRRGASLSGPFPEPPDDPDEPDTLNGSETPDDDPPTPETAPDLD